MFLPEPQSFELTPSGAFVARCYRFIDLGTHENNYMGQVKDQHRISISWELPTELMADGRPFSASKRYTWSMHEKATLRKDLEGWRGRKFTDADFKGPDRFNTKKLIGVPCLLTILHEEGQNGTYAKVATISPVPKGMEVPAAVNKAIYLGIDQQHWDAAVFDGLHEKIKELITTSPEYKYLFEGHKNRQPVHEDLSDEIPF